MTSGCQVEHGLVFSLGMSTHLLDKIKAWQGTEPATTPVDHGDIRGWGTTLLVSVGAPASVCIRGPAYAASQRYGGLRQTGAAPLAMPYSSYGIVRPLHECRISRQQVSLHEK